MALSGCRRPEGALEGKLFGQEVQYIQKWIDLVKQKGIRSPEVQALDKISVEDILKEGGAPKDIIDLYGKKVDYLPWGKLPFRDPSERIARVG